MWRFGFNVPPNYNDMSNYCGGKENLIPKDFDFINRVFSATLIETCYVNLSEENLFIRMERQQSSFRPMDE